MIRTATLALLMLAPLPAEACALSVGSGGVLKLSSDAQRLGSDEPGGVAATLTITNALLAGDFRLTIARPTVAGPAGFDNGAAQTFVAYTISGLLASHGSDGFLSGSSSFDVKGLLNALAVVMTIHNRVTSPNGFRTGDYQTQTVITCSSI